MNRHALQQVARRTFGSSARRQVDNKVPQKQKVFQEDNGLPIHLKGGAADAVLYRTTMALTVLGAEEGGGAQYELRSEQEEELSSEQEEELSSEQEEELRSEQQVELRSEQQEELSSEQEEELSSEQEEELRSEQEEVLRRAGYVVYELLQAAFPKKS
ncbi:Cytochrome c oxidase subunit 7A2, mitochondrial [Liparis tanakae]|uniref:Cytochrome c oxidase subunit 7A2, mitochondrial n=1 Tax=Liparis tanakae TaxID=230148 RepID=A0A4Z2FEE3_9TELE|nr:Cytochrome c oxidase subunit 7A2, mitochondrial [Liparis tanakae]